MPYYVIHDKEAPQNEDVLPRLVEAANPAQAIRHCAARYTAAAASTADAVDLMQKGVKPERAQ